MKHLALLLALLLTTLAHADYIGTITEIHRFDDGGIILNLDGKWPHQKMALYIHPQNVEKFPDLPQPGTRVTGIGETVDHEGHPEIILTAPEQLKPEPK